MANFRRNLLKKTVSKSAAVQAERLLGQVTKEDVVKTHPRMKVSKRMAKKLASTGRTSTQQKIDKKLKLDLDLIERLKKQGRPTIPKKKPKFHDAVVPPKGKMKDNTNNLPLIEEIIAARERDINYNDINEDFRMRDYLTNMLTSMSGYFDAECIQKLKDAIYEADPQTLEMIANHFGGRRGIRDWYNDMKSRNKSRREAAEAHLMSLFSALGIDCSI